MTFLLLKCGIIQYAILFIAIGITADNLMIAKLTGKTVSIISRANWILILLLLFITQNQMLLWGRWITSWAPSLTTNQKDWLALGLLISIGAKMYKIIFKTRKMQLLSIIQQIIYCCWLLARRFTFSFSEWRFNGLTEQKTI